MGHRAAGATGRNGNRRIAVAVVMVALVSLAALACSSRNAERPATERDSKDISPENGSGEVHGWIAYRDGSEIVAVDPADPAKTISLVTADDRALIDWSRDGTRLLLQGRSQDALYIMNADGSETRLTRQGLFINGGSFSPDGSMVAYGTDDGISVIEAEGGGTPRLVAASDPSTMTWLQDPAWSPDGSRIAFVAYGELRRDYAISVVNADGTGPRELIDVRGGVAGLAWSPDGSQLIFSDGGGIYAVGEDGSGLRIVTKSRNTAALAAGRLAERVRDHLACPVAGRFADRVRRVRRIRTSALLSLPTVGRECRRHRAAPADSSGGEEPLAARVVAGGRSDRFSLIAIEGYKPPRRLGAPSR